MLDIVLYTFGTFSYILTGLWIGRKSVRTWAEEAEKRYCRADKELRPSLSAWLLFPSSSVCGKVGQVDNRDNPLNEFVANVVLVKRHENADILRIDRVNYAWYCAWMTVGWPVKVLFNMPFVFFCTVQAVLQILFKPPANLMLESKESKVSDEPSSVELAEAKREIESLLANPDGQLARRIEAVRTEKEQ